MDSIDWSHAEDHMWRRHRVLVAWAREAWTDPFALVLDPDPSSRSGVSLRVIGYSRTARTVLVVVAVRGDESFVVASAWQANTSHLRRYWQERFQNDIS